MTDTSSMCPFRSVVEKIQCNRLVRPRFGMYIRNLTLSSLLASPEKGLTSSMRSLLTSDCGVAKLTEAYDSVMNIAPLRNTSRVFPREVIAWASMAVDESDVPRLPLNGQPSNAVTSLRRLHLPDVLTAEEMKREPTLIIVDIHLASSKKKKLHSFRKGNGWTDALIMDLYGTSVGLRDQQPHPRSHQSAPRSCADNAAIWRQRQGHYYQRRFGQPQGAHMVAPHGGERPCVR